MSEKAGSYILEVMLDEISPPITRTLQVPADMTLNQLHMVLQVAMEWEQYHLHLFEVGGKSYGLQSFVDYPPDLQCSLTTRLSDLYLKPDDTFLYEYDFGDSWRHILVVNDVTEEEIPYPICLDGCRCAPPEDAGGAWGYREMLDILADPEHREHKSIVQWLGENFDPEHFSLTVTNTHLHWYWEHRECLPSQRSADNMVRHFLAEMHHRLRPGTVDRYRSDMGKVLEFLDRYGFYYVYIDGVLLRMNEVEFSRVADPLPLLMSLDDFFWIHLPQHLVMGSSVIKGCRATMGQFINWLHEEEIICEDVRDHCEETIKEASEWGLQIREKYWWELDYPDADDITPSRESFRCPVQVMQVGDTGANLVDTETTRMLREVRVAPELLRRLKPGTYLGARITIGSEGYYLTGALYPVKMSRPD